MWLPAHYYERAPQFWLLLGLLFITSGTYMQFEGTMSFVYVGVGICCVAWSACIIVMRARNRRESPPAEITDVTPPLDRTQPVHVSERMHAIRMQSGETPPDVPADAVRN